MWHSKQKSIGKAEDVSHKISNIIRNKKISLATNIMFNSYVGLVLQCVNEYWTITHIWSRGLLKNTVNTMDSTCNQCGSLKEMERKDRLFQDQKVSVWSFWIYIVKGG